MTVEMPAGRYYAAPVTTQFGERWVVRDRTGPGSLAYYGSRKITFQGDKEHAEADAEWLNSVTG